MEIDNENIGLIFGVIMVLVIIALVVLVMNSTPTEDVAILDENQQTLLGGDKDEHGCIISAGYSWCESKQICVKLWEFQCDD